MHDADAPMVVMGVDPGLGTTGWGVVKVESAAQYRYLDSGRIRTSTREQVGDRLNRIFRELQSVAEKFGVTLCAVESGFVGRGPLSALKLGEARAAAILAAETMEIPVTCIAPREIKMAITGRGAAAKEQVSFMVGRMLGLSFDPGEEDISDALAAALCLVLHERHAALPLRDR